MRTLLPLPLSNWTSAVGAPRQQQKTAREWSGHLLDEQKLQVTTTTADIQLLPKTVSD